MLAVVIPYFNFTGSRQRLINLETARRTYQCDVFYFEMYSGRFELAHVPNCYHCFTPKPIWCKENAINLMGQWLPVKYDKIIWADADVVFSPGWEWAANKALDEYMVIQPYRTVDTYDSSFIRKRSFASSFKLAQDCSNTSHGFAWGARREFFTVGLYDKMVVGGGDSALAFAVSGRPELFQPVDNKLLIDDYLDWSGRVSNLVNGSVGFSEGEIWAIPHGTTEGRRYKSRHQILANYNPQTDIAYKDGIIGYSDTCQQSLMDGVVDYFVQRGD